MRSYTHMLTRHTFSWPSSCKPLPISWESCRSVA